MEGSLTMLSLIVSIGVFLGLSNGFFLLFKKSAKNKANIYLGILTLLFTIQLWRPFTFYMGWIEYFPHTFKVESIFTLAIPPITYFYVRACTQKNFAMRPILWLHFIPMVLDIIYNIPLLSLSGAEKLAMIRQYMESGKLILPIFVPIVKISISLVYFILSTKLIFQYRKHLSNNTSTVDEAFHRWLLVFSSMLVYPFFGVGFFIIFNASAFMYMGWIAFILAVYLSTLLKPELFHAFPHQMPLPNSTEEKSQRYENSNLQNEQKEIYLEQLLNFIKKEKPYLAPELTLAQLSTQTKIPSNHLSQVINERMQCNFLDFINSYRIEEAKNKLANKSFEHYTIIAIAFEVGFNSKTAFYSAFKKFTNTTPSAFRKTFMTDKVIIGKA